MQINLLLFATLKDAVGERRITLSLPTADTITVGALREHLMQRYPHAAANFKVAIAAHNQNFADPDAVVQHGDEVAFFPPVSGGNPPDVFLLAHQPINHDELIAKITTPATGAVCLFSGFVRGETTKTGHLPQTEYLEYEAYEPMAIAKMQQVADEIRQRWADVQGIAIVQRIGKLQVGENTVLIACAAAHRDNGCFEAARYGIDRLKEIVPVWKKEIGKDGETWIEGDYHPTPSD